MIANIHDRASIEQVYPHEHFARDVGRNSDAKAVVLHGVRILSGLDGAGEFTVVEASRHVGEDTGDAEGIFLCPFLVTAADAAAERPGYDQSEAAPGAHQREKPSDYDAFIDRVIQAAKSAPSRAAPGRGDERLRGPRQ